MESNERERPEDRRPASGWFPNLIRQGAALGVLGSALALLVLTGCTTWPLLRSNNGGSGVGPARMPTETPTAAALVAYLNDNSRRVQSLECRGLDLDCRQRSQAVGLSGWMVCQKPKSLRMGGKVLGHPAVDMGSNDQEFWYWISKADPPYLFHCSHQDLAQGQARVMPFPFQPDWVVEALGIGEYGPPENYQVAVRASTVELVQRATSPQGQPIRKVTVFNRGQVRGTAPQVMAYLVQDANGRDMCAAYITETQQDRATGAVLPRRVRLIWPAEQIELKMKLDEVTVNPQMDEQRVSRLFTRPTMAGIQSYDLARGLDGPTGPLQRAGGLMR